MHKKRFCTLFEAALNKAPNDNQMRLRCTECLAAEKKVSDWNLP
jgi:hypothetical protein